MEDNNNKHLQLSEEVDSLVKALINLHNNLEYLEDNKLNNLQVASLVEVLELNNLLDFSEEQEALNNRLSLLDNHNQVLDHSLVVPHNNNNNQQCLEINNSNNQSHCSEVLVEEHKLIYLEVINQQEVAVLAWAKHNKHNQQDYLEQLLANLHKGHSLDKISPLKHNLHLYSAILANSNNNNNHHCFQDLVDKLLNLKEHLELNHLTLENRHLYWELLASPNSNLSLPHNQIQINLEHPVAQIFSANQAYQLSQVS